MLVNQRWLVRKPDRQSGARGKFWIAHVRDKRNGFVHHFSTGVEHRGKDYDDASKAAQKKVEQQILHWIAEEERHETEKPQRRVGFAAAYREFLKEKEGTVRPSTLRDYTYTFEGVYRDHFRSRCVSEIRQADLKALLKRDVSNKTRKKYLTELKEFLRWSRHEDRRYTERDPCLDVKVKAPARRVGYPLTEGEARSLLKACHEPMVVELKPQKFAGRRKNAWTQTHRPPRHLFLAVLCAIYTGLRRSAVLSIRWGDLNFARRWVTIPAERQKDDQDLRLPLHRVLERELRRELAGRAEVDPEALVFGGLTEITRSFKTALDRARLPLSVRWHDLRHTYSDWLRRRTTASVKDLLMGHSTPQGVSARYEHPTWEELDAAIQSLPNLLDPVDTEEAKTVNSRA